MQNLIMDLKKELLINKIFLTILSTSVLAYSMWGFHSKGYHDGVRETKNQQIFEESQRTTNIQTLARDVHQWAIYSPDSQTRALGRMLYWEQRHIGQADK